MGEHDFPTWAPADLDKYKPPADWKLEPARQQSSVIDAWLRNALNLSILFAMLYGDHAPSGRPHLAPRKAAVGKLYQMHIRNPNKYTMSFLPNTWASLNSRWVEELQEQVNKICHLRRVERPTLADLWETGLSPDPTGQSTFRFPTTFDIDSPSGIFQRQILGSLERDFERLRGDAYRKAPPAPSGRNAGPDIPIGPNMTTRERRLCALSSPRTTAGAVI